MKDNRNRLDEVGESSSEQHFRKSTAITFMVWNPTPSTNVFYGWQAGWQTKYKLISKFSKLAVGRNI